ncbi:hypothetical protein B0H11DRAFT_1924368 [Mycena galericulata]|nr:hypothetical protein B0H11DRAFT_1924368 [Mycena galericulata]
MYSSVIGSSCSMEWDGNKGRPCGRQRKFKKGRPPDEIATYHVRESSKFTEYRPLPADLEFADILQFCYAVGAETRGQIPKNLELHRNFKSPCVPQWWAAGIRYTFLESKGCTADYAVKFAGGEWGSDESTFKSNPWISKSFHAGPGSNEKYHKEEKKEKWEHHGRNDLHSICFWTSPTPGASNSKDDPSIWQEGSDLKRRRCQDSRLGGFGGASFDCFGILGDIFKPMAWRHGPDLVRNRGARESSLEPVENLVPWQTKEERSKWV